MFGRQTKFPSESVQADICLGVTIAGIETLVAMGLFLAFTQEAASVGGLFHSDLRMHQDIISAALSIAGTGL